MTSKVPWRGSEPGAEGDLGGVVSGVLADAVQRSGAHPQDHPPEVVRVPRDLGVEEAGRGGLGPQQFLGVVQVVPGLFDRPLGVVVEPAVLVAADDVPGLKGLDLIDRAPLGPEAADRALAQVHMDPVVDGVASHDQP